MKRGLWVIISSVLFIVGAVILIGSLNMTGNVIGENIGKTTGSILGLALIIGGILVFMASSGGGLEIKVWEERKRVKDKDKIEVHLMGMPEIIPGDLIITKNPIPEERTWSINLEAFKEALGSDTISKEDKEKLAEKYGPALKEIIYKGFVENGEYRKEWMDMNKEEKTEERIKNKNERKKIAKDVRYSRAVERVLEILDDKYKPRTKKLGELKKASDVTVYNPIQKGKAVYVRFTSGKDVDRIKEDKILKHGDAQALMFPDMKAAEKFLDGTTQGYAKSLTGGKNAQKAVIFQTVYVPDKVNRLVGKKSRSIAKGFFKDLPLSSCYTIGYRNVPKK